MSDAIPSPVLSAFGAESAEIERIPVGLINRTYRVRTPSRDLVVQKLHPIFGPEVNRDIDAITKHLQAHGMVTPRVVPTATGALWVEHEGEVWRALTFLEGRTLDSISSPQIAREAGALVGRFHRATASLVHRFEFGRSGVHDTPHHLTKLRLALHGTDPHVSATEPVAQAILEHAERLETLPELPQRLIHGDLKFSNLLFDDELANGIALLDLDTMAQGILAHEMGDAFRSWCNPSGENIEASRFDPEIFAFAVSGWAHEIGPISKIEQDTLVLGTETIALELACRFAVDAVEDHYFGWDAQRFESRHAHNLTRARSQLSLANSIRTQRRALVAIVHQAFA